LRCALEALVIAMPDAAGALAAYVTSCIARASMSLPTTLVIWPPRLEPRVAPHQSCWLPRARPLRPSVDWAGS